MLTAKDRQVQDLELELMKLSAETVPGVIPRLCCNFILKIIIIVIAVAMVARFIV